MLYVINIARIYNFIGGIHHKKIENDQAIEYFKKAINALGEESPFLNYNIGMSYRKKEDYKKAIEYFKKVLKFIDEPLIRVPIIELELLINNKIEEKTKSFFISKVDKNSRDFLMYKILKVLSDISNGEDVQLSKLISKYKNHKLGNYWSFKRLEKWASKKDENIKRKLISTIEIIKKEFNVTQKSAQLIF